MSNASFFDSCFEPLLRQTKCTFFQLGQFMAKEQNATLFQIVCQVNRLWKTLHKKCFFSVREFAENWRAKRHRLVHDHFRCGIPWMRNEMTPLILSVSLQFWLVGVQFASVLVGRRAVQVVGSSLVAFYIQSSCMSGMHPMRDAASEFKRWRISLQRGPEGFMILFYARKHFFHYHFLRTLNTPYFF